MNAHVRNNQNATLLSPARLADYVLKLENRLGRQVDRATVLPGGGIEVRIGGTSTPANPADLVDMNE